MKLAVITAHAGADSLQDATNSWIGEPLFWTPENTDVLAIRKETCPPVFIINGNSGMLQAYEFAYRHVPDADILAFFHDDVLIHDKDWVARVLAEFEDPTVGLVGFAGGKGHGHPQMYQIPYEYTQLARHDFVSNMLDAEHHGNRILGSTEAVVLDGFSLIVRRDVLEKAGGWQSAIDLLSNESRTEPLHHCYDYFLSCMTRRLGYRIRVVGIRCEHKGGRTYVRLGAGIRESNWTQFVAAHRAIYDSFRDVLPARVP
jgi:hypothetical protein